MHREIGNLNRIVGLGKESEVSAFNRSIVQVIGMLENELLVATNKRMLMNTFEKYSQDMKESHMLFWDEGMLWWQNVIVSETDKTYVIFLGSDGRYKVQSAAGNWRIFMSQAFSQEWREGTQMNYQR